MSVRDALSVVPLAGGQGWCAVSCPQSCQWTLGVCATRAGSSGLHLTSTLAEPLSLLHCRPHLSAKSSRKHLPAAAQPSSSVNSEKRNSAHVTAQHGTPRWPLCGRVAFTPAQALRHPHPRVLASWLFVTRASARVTSWVRPPRSPGLKQACWHPQISPLLSRLSGTPTCVVVTEAFPGPDRD